MSDLNTRIKIFLESKAAEGSVRELKKEMALLNREIDKAPVGSQRYNDALKKLQEGNAILTQHRQNVKGVESGLGSLATKFGPIAAAAGITFSVDALIGYGKQLFDTATKLEALGKKAATVFADQLPKVTQAAKENAAAMGLTNSEYIAAAANIQDLLIPMGFQRAEAANISTGLVNLSGALSEWTGGQKSATEVSQILNKALLGEREELKSLGISISENDVKNRLAEKGLSKLTGSTLEQAKAAATLELITEKSTDAQTAFANGAGSLTRQQAEMSARWRSINEQLSTALIPVFNRLLEAAMPVVEGISDLVTALTEGEDAAKKTSPTMQFLASIFGFLGDVIGFVWDVQKRWAAFLFTNLAPAIKVIGTGVFELVNGIGWAANKVAELIGIDVRMQPIDTTAFRASIDEIVKSVNSADSSVQKIKAAPTNTQTTGGGKATGGKDSGTQSKDKTAEYERKAKAAAEKAEQARQREAAAAFRRSMQDDEIADIEAFALEVDEEQERIRKERAAAEEERRIAAQDSEIEARALISAETQSKYDLERQKLNEHYIQLLDLANQYGIDTTALREKWAAQETEIAKRETQERLNARTQELAATAASFGALGDQVVEFAELLGANAETAAGLRKVFVLAQIAFDTAAAISSLTAASSANPLNAVTAGAAGIAQYASGIVRILTNIAKAKQLLFDAPKVQQKFTGGWNDVTGADDGRTYHAQYIGRPGTGMLNYNHPVILANERGREYYVDHHTLRNPVALRHVQAIENLKRGTATQMAEGGFTPSANTTSVSALDAPALTNAIMALVGILSGGHVYAQITDKALLDIDKRMAKIAAAKG